MTNIKMKNNVKENIAVVTIAMTMVASIVFFAESKEYDEGSTEGKTPYELYPDAYENSSFNPANGYIYNNGINYESR